LERRRDIVMGQEELKLESGSLPPPLFLTNIPLSPQSVLFIGVYISGLGLADSFVLFATLVYIL
jgi:hypothetical protein